MILLLGHTAIPTDAIISVDISYYPQQLIITLIGGTTFKFNCALKAPQKPKMHWPNPISNHDPESLKYDTWLNMNADEKAKYNEAHEKWVAETEEYSKNVLNYLLDLQKTILSYIEQNELRYIRIDNISDNDKI